MAITPLPTPPSATRPATFNTECDAFLAALPQFVTEANALAATAYPPGMFFGFDTNYNAVSPNTKIDVSSGKCRDSGDAQNIIAAAGFTIDAGVVGANGIDAGALAASTTYASYVIMKADGTTAGLLSTNLTTPTLPSGYLYKRRILYHKTNSSSQLIKYKQNKRRVDWEVMIDNGSGTFGSAAAILVTLGLPIGAKVEAMFNAQTDAASNNDGYIWTDPDLPDTAPGSTALTSQAGAGTAGAAIRVLSQLRIMCDTSGRVRFRSSNGTASYHHWTTGFYDYN